VALRAVPDHPKFSHLKALLGCPKGVALGYLECLWHFAGRFTPQGNIGKYQDKAIESWIEWEGEPGALIAALVESKWLDRDDQHRLLVHDWAHHADKATKNALTRGKLTFCTPTVRIDSQAVRTPSPTCGTAYGLPEPVPEPVPEPESKTLSAAQTAAEFELIPETLELTRERRDGSPRGKAQTNGTAKNPPLSVELEAELDQVARRIHARHPAIRRCGIAEVKKLLRGILRRFPLADRLATLNRVDRNHEAWCGDSEWQKDGGQFSKGLGNWLAPFRDRWDEPPPTAQGGMVGEPARLMM